MVSRVFLIRSTVFISLNCIRCVSDDRRLTVHEFIASLLTDSAVASIDNGAGPMTGASAASLGRGDRTREPAYQYRMRAEQRPEPNGPSEVTPLLLLLQNKVYADIGYVCDPCSFLFIVGLLYIFGLFTAMYDLFC